VGAPIEGAHVKDLFVLGAIKIRNPGEVPILSGGTVANRGCLNLPHKGRQGCCACRDAKTSKEGATIE